MASNRELARRYFEELFTRRNFDALDEYCAQDCLFHDQVHGPLDLGEMKQVLRDNIDLFPIISARLEDVVDAGDTQVLRYTLRASMNGPFAGFQPTGNAGEAAGMAILNFQDGKIIEQWALWNIIGLLQQTGALVGHQEEHAIWLDSDATALALD